MKIPNSSKNKRRLKFRILEQPDDITCGPTALQSIYDFYGDNLSLGEIIQEIPMLNEGGTLSAVLACHALRRGYSAKIYTCNLQLFDPSWFHSDVDLVHKLKLQKKFKKSAKLSYATDSYLEFLRLGGEVRLRDINLSLLRSYLDQQIPVLTGLSATHLYRCSRELDDTSPDDVRGSPAGHFVVLCGYNKKTKKIRVADPYRSNPISQRNFYDVKLDRLLGSIFLGVLTYDANLLIIRPK